jgi:hypothetical protein
MVFGLACVRRKDAIAVTFGPKQRQLALFEHPTVKFRTVARYAMA